MVFEESGHLLRKFTDGTIFIVFLNYSDYGLTRLGLILANFSQFLPTTPLGITRVIMLLKLYFYYSSK